VRKLEPLWRTIIEQAGITYTDLWYLYFLQGIALQISLKKKKKKFKKIQ